MTIMRITKENVKARAIREGDRLVAERSELDRAGRFRDEAGRRNHVELAS